MLATGPTSTATSSASLPPDPPAPATILPVIRGGKRPSPTLSAPVRPFDRSTRFQDGVTLAVTAARAGKVTGAGPGVFPGAEVTALNLRVINGSNRPVDLAQVVVTATYGTPRRMASTVYDDASRDFTGVVAPGRSADATYVLAIPAAELDDVSLTVDLDGQHQPASFAGPVTTQ